MLGPTGLQQMVEAMERVLEPLLPELLDAAGVPPRLSLRGEVERGGGRFTFPVLFACWLRDHPRRELGMWRYYPEALCRLPWSLASQSESRPPTRAARALQLASVPRIQSAGFLAVCDPVTFLDWVVTGDPLKALTRSLDRHLQADRPRRPGRGALPESAAFDDTADQVIGDQAEAELIARLRSTCTPAEAEVIEMRGKDDLAFAEIAAQRGTSVSTAKVLAWRVRRKMGSPG
jgi:DNA-binding CsgD family transcriptional regulator